MGWTGIPKRFNTIREFCDKEFTYETDSYINTVVDVAQVNFSEVYIALKQFFKHENETHILGIVMLIRYEKNEFYYKTLPETTGPAVYRCPERILKLLTPITNKNRINENIEWAIEWREKCWDTIKKRQKLKKIKVGDTLIFNRPIHFTDNTAYTSMTVLKKPTKRCKSFIMSSNTNTTNYRLSRNTLVEFLEKIQN